MSTKYGYIRTSRQRQAGAAGSDPQSQARQLQLAGVAPAHVYRDVGVSGTTGTNSRTAWHALDSRLTAGDSLVVASIDRIGRRWLDTVNAVIDLRDRGVKIVSLSADEAQWVAYLAADPDSPEAALHKNPDLHKKSGFCTKTMSPSILWVPLAGVSSCQKPKQV